MPRGRPSKVPDIGEIEQDVTADDPWFIEQDVMDDHAVDQDEGEPEQEAEEEGEEEYEVQAIVAHKMIKAGHYKFLVAWKGYGPEHNTWEPAENVEHASNIVNAYWQKHRNENPNSDIQTARKRGRRSSPTAAAPASRKVGRRGRASSANGDSGSEDSHVDGAEAYEDVADWEDQVESIDLVERGADGTLMVCLTMTGGQKIKQTSDVVYKRCPQKMLQYYESHLKWRSA